MKLLRNFMFLNISSSSRVKLFRHFLFNISSSSRSGFKLEEAVIIVSRCPFPVFRCRSDFKQMNK